jgi:hypothetical protein
MHTNKFTFNSTRSPHLLSYFKYVSTDSNVFTVIILDINQRWTIRPLSQVHTVTEGGVISLNVTFDGSHNGQRPRLMCCCLSQQWRHLKKITHVPCSLLYSLILLRTLPQQSPLTQKPHFKAQKVIWKCILRMTAFVMKTYPFWFQISAGRA